MKSLTILIIFSLLAFLNMGCGTHPYQYVEIDKGMGAFSTGTKVKDPKKILAKSDSEAYARAYEYFCIAVKVSNDMKKLAGGPAEMPLSFTLLDPSGKDITNEVLFSQKVKDSIQNAIFRLPSNIDESKDEISTTQPTIIVDSVQIMKLKKFFNVKKDEFDPDGKQWYTPKSAPQYINRNGIYCYFQVENDMPSNFRIEIQYYGDDWLFIQKYQFSIDGKAYEFLPTDVQRDNGDGGYVWEWCDESILGDDTQLIRALANAKEAKMKILGRQYFKIKTITKEQVLGVKHCLDLYEAMGGILQ